MKRNAFLMIVIMALVILTVVIFSTVKNDDKEYLGWSNYAGSKDGIRYSSGDEITRDNVENLRVVWMYDTKDSAVNTQIQCNPIMIDGIVYGVSPQMNLFAVNALTGVEQWVFKPPLPKQNASIRGIAYWQSVDGGDRRIFYSVGAKLYAVNALNGKMISSFAKEGCLDLRENLDGNYERHYVSGNAPGIIYKDLLIVGMRVSEGADAAPGHIRAFNVRTGKREWIFHTIPHPGDVGYDSWDDPDAWQKIGGANNWGGMSLDEERGIVYIPTGSASPDFYGGDRKGSNLFANCIIALDAATGKYIWHYQVVHHDLWDRDLPANPGLVSIKHNGQVKDCIAQITKHGYIFLLDRTNGKPIFPIREVAVPFSNTPGEQAWPTQPVPTLPEPFARNKLDSEDLATRTPEIHKELVERFKTMKSGNLFTPPHFQGTIVFPGFDGGGEWGGAAIDPQSQVLYVNARELPSWTSIIENPEIKVAKSTTLKQLGQHVYNRSCLSCHGPEKKGNGKNFPTLINLNKRSNEAQVTQVIQNGRGMMPSFQHMDPDEKKALVAFLLDQKDEKLTLKTNEARNKRKPVSAYIHTGYEAFIASDGYPATNPPWGTLNAVNLSTGKLLWKVPLGEFEELRQKGVPPTGTSNYGGPVVTKGGLVFIAGTQDAKIRAFDKRTGEIVWEASLPNAAFATPAVYSIKGKQYIVIACGGGRGTRGGSKYVAFALP